MKEAREFEKCSVQCGIQYAFAIAVIYLLDTNIIVPLEPASKVDLEINSNLALEFNRLASKAKQSVFVHPSIEKDLERDRDRNRAALRRTLLQRYQMLERPPCLNPTALAILGDADPDSNDWVDDQLLAGLLGNAVDYLVTEDAGIHKKARKLGLQSRTLRLAEAVNSLQDLFEEQPPVPPAVSQMNAYELDESDAIFDSLRNDYRGFDQWLAKCKCEHRNVFAIKDSSTQKLAAFCLIKAEDRNEFGLTGKILKLCTFKVSEDHNGNRYGELLLKPIFDLLWENKYDHAFVTAFEKQQSLIELFRSFGFEQSDAKTALGEVVMVKTFKFGRDEKERLHPVEFNRRFGPWITKFSGNKTYVVPIQPQFHKTLFPEFENQQVLTFGLAACGNSIRKAYLSNAAITTVQAGDNLLFYRSTDYKAATSIGIVEESLRTEKPEEIARFVGKRTVYPFKEIERMCARSPVLAVKFRRVLFLNPTISLNELVANDCVTAAPQSIQMLKVKGTEWLSEKLKM